MLDFQSGIDDHLTGITHIIRGIDLQDSAKRQRFVYDYFDWEYPEVIHWGHVQIDEYDVAMSTSTIRRLVEEGELEGWDDPRAPTIASLRRRGIRGEAIVGAMVELGTSTNNVDLSMSAVYASNRDLIDDETDRRFMVRDGVDKTLIGAPEVGEPPVHPDHEDRGRRHIEHEGGVLVAPADLPPNGKRVWLKGLGCFRHTRDALEYTPEDVDVIHDEGVDVVHWVPAENNRPVTMHTMDGDVEGRAEPGIGEYDPDDVVQFERVGFARIDTQEDDETVTYFAHE
jgi:glutamyl-tRNA synthetase